MRSPPRRRRSCAYRVLVIYSIRDVTTSTSRIDIDEGILADGRRSRVQHAPRSPSRAGHRATRHPRGPAGRRVRAADSASTTGSATARAGSTSRASASTSPPTLVMQAVEAGAFTARDARQRAAPPRRARRASSRPRATRMSRAGRPCTTCSPTPPASPTTSRVPSPRAARCSELVLAEPDRFWTPADLLDFSRRRQRPVGRPGERFAYSDTGYILLGRVLEQATGRAFHELLHERILTPLGMRDSALLFYSRPGERRVAAATSTTATRRTTRRRSTAADAADRAVPPRPARGQHVPQRELRLGGRRHRLHARRPAWRSARRSTAAS